MRSRIAIIGAGPAGMFLAHMLHAAKIDAVVIERRDREYVEDRVRASVLEQGTVALMQRLGTGDRIAREGLIHGGTNLSFDGTSFRIDMAALTGATVTVCGQQEVMKDLFDAAEACRLDIRWNAADVALHDIDEDRPCVTWRDEDGARRLDCDYVVACDAYHGIGRASVPAERTALFERAYPFGWLGILADVPSVDHELIYANHERGFALASMRSATRSRYYLQCALDERIEDWPDDRFWDELAVRLGLATAARLVRGPSSRNRSRRCARSCASRCAGAACS